MAQTPEDAIRMSWNAPSGTARHQAIGGAMGSLGGEITSIYVNPAGLGFYKTNEFVLSPGITFMKGGGTFRGTTESSDGSSRFNLGTTGFVWSQPGSGKWRNTTFSIAVNKTANFNGRTYYEGLNNYSSFSESFVEEFSNSGSSLDDPIYSMPVSMATKLAVYTYLIDTVTINGNVEVIGLPLRDAILNGKTAELFQSRDITTRGGISEVSFGFAGNLEDKFYVGGSVGVPIVNYERTSVFTERDFNNNLDSFQYARYREDYSSKGVGLNARIGIIFKPVEKIRAGLSIHTPTIYGLRELTTGRMEADLEGYFRNGELSVGTTDNIYADEGADVPQYRYDLVSPWKFLVSGSYVFNEVADVTRQRGFITADLEYVTHSSSKFSSNDASDREYYAGVNDAVKLLYKSAVNFRLGAELKFNTFMTRLGFAYYGNPYKDEALNAKRMNLSGGVGYRNRGMFLDLAYVHSLHRDVDFPYRLADKANTFAETKNRNGNLILTFGVKF